MTFGPISSTPISSSFGGGGGGPSPPPVALVSVPIAANSVKYRYREPYVSDATNVKFLGVPRGVYVGFTPSLSGGVLTLAPDTTYGVSLLRVTSQTSTTSVDIYTNEPVTLDFNSHIVFPVYVLGRVNSNIGGPTTAEIVTSVVLPTTPEEVQICTVVNPTTILFDAPANREEPYAFASADLGFGFMRDGAVEELIAAVAVVTEVQNARVDFTGTTQVDLNTRLTVDGVAVTVADRLANTTRAVQSLDYVTAGSVQSITVGDSFSAIYRTTGPLENIDGFGSENSPGAITSGVVPLSAPVGAVADAVRNVCVVVNSTTGHRLMDSTTPIYGRLSLVDGEITGTAVFTIASPAVDGVGTLFLIEVFPGDILCDSTGNCYRVLTVNANFGIGAITLSTPSLASDTVPLAPHHRFTLSFVMSNGAGGETPATVPIATPLRFFFTVWRSVQTAVFDRTVILHQNGEPTPVPVATTSVPGRALLAVAGTLAGAIKTIKDNGTVVGSGNFNTLNFEGCADAGAGVLDVTQRGPTGPAGTAATGGTTGPTGPAGATGPGLVARSYIVSGTYSHQFLGPGVVYDFDSGVVGFTILFVTGGIQKMLGDSPFTNYYDHFEIQNIVRLTTNTARLTGRVPSGGAHTGVYSYYMILAGQT